MKFKKRPEEEHSKENTAKGARETKIYCNISLLQ